jgi:hypothetical protein
MRYSTASLVVLVALATRTSQTNAFVSAPSSVTFSRAKPLSASVVASEVEELTYHSVNQLAFRQLQKECKARSLPATGNTASLRTRLLEFHGVCLVDATVNGDADSEVRQYRLSQPQDPKEGIPVTHFHKTFYDRIFSQLFFFHCVRV